jgi:hypothetical protein
VPRHTRSDKERHSASREADRLASQAKAIERRLGVGECEQAVEEAEAYDGRDLFTGQPLPGRPAHHDASPLEGLRRAAEEANAVADKMAERVKFSGANVRTQALSNVAWAEREAQEACERWWEADSLARDYTGGLTPCADPDCTAELPRSAAYSTFNLCPVHLRIRLGVSRPTN